MGRKTLAVTGASGFVGSTLVELALNRGWDVRAYSRSARSSETPHLTWVTGGLSDPAALDRFLRGADAVVHLAGAIKAWDRSAFFKANVDGATAVATAAKRAHVSVFVHVSSLAAGAPTVSDYAASKAAGEAAALGIGDGAMRVIVVRPPAVYGPGDRETRSLIMSAGRGLAITPKPRAKLALIHVDDLARALLHCCGVTDLAERVVTVDDGSPQGYTMAQIAALASGEPLARVRVISPPLVLVRLLAKLNVAISAFRRQPAMLTPGKVAEIAHGDWQTGQWRLAEASDWQPQIPASDGLPATYAWYQQSSSL